MGRYRPYPHLPSSRCASEFLQWRKGIVTSREDKREDLVDGVNEIQVVGNPLSRAAPVESQLRPVASVKSYQSPLRRRAVFKLTADLWLALW